MLCFRKLPVAKKYMEKKGGGGGISRFSFETFLSDSAGEIRRGTL